jgi:hypothetical protein
MPFAESADVTTESAAGFADALGQAWRKALLQLQARLERAD